MFVQLALGAALLTLSVLVHITAIRLIEDFLTPRGEWFLRKPYRPRVTIGLVGLVLSLMASHSACCWLWAVAFLTLGTFVTLEPALYFSIVTFTTLGYGDVVLPTEWRILGAICAATGLLIFGISTAVIVEFLVRVRRAQNEAATQ